MQYNKAWSHLKSESKSFLQVNLRILNWSTFNTRCENGAWSLQKGSRFYWLENATEVPIFTKVFHCRELISNDNHLIKHVQKLFVWFLSKQLCYISNLWMNYIYWTRRVFWVRLLHVMCLEFFPYSNFFLLSRVGGTTVTAEFVNLIEVGGTVTQAATHNKQQDCNKHIAMLSIHGRKCANNNAVGVSLTGCWAFCQSN